MLKIGTWNIRGLNNPLKQKEVRSVISANKFSLMDVVETKVRDVNLQATINLCFPRDWKAIHNFNSGPVARIILGWDSSIFQLLVVFQSEQIIVVDVLVLEDKRNFLLSVVYGHNGIRERRHLWDDMRTIFTSVGLKPWLQLGDLNEVRTSAERLVGFDCHAAAELNQCLIDISQDDMPSKGFWFTWSNKRGGGGSNKSKLDRVLVNTEWLDMFPTAEASFLAPGVSDHCLISVTMVPPNGRRKPFKFFNFWLQHPEFGQILTTSWNESLGGGTHVCVICQVEKTERGLEAPQFDLLF